MKKLIEFKLKKLIREVIKETTKVPIELPNTNILIRGFGRDVNGNSVIKLEFFDGAKTSIQTNGNLPKTHSIGKRVKLADLTDSDLNTISREVADYISNYGSSKMKQKLKVFSENIKKKVKNPDNYKRFISENTDYSIDDFESASDVYSIFGKKFPYAADLVALRVFGDRSDNVIHKAIKGIYGGSLDEYELNKYFQNYENSWYENMETIEDDLVNMELDNGNLLINEY